VASASTWWRERDAWGDVSLRRQEADGIMARCAPSTNWWPRRSLRT
jgi:hypothetical protein